MKQHGIKRIAALVAAVSCLLLPGCGDANQPIEPERITQLDVDFTFSQEGLVLPVEDGCFAVEIDSQGEVAVRRES